MRGLFNPDGRINRFRLVKVSIRLADAWPFQLVGRWAAQEDLWFQSALRMRGLFNTWWSRSTRTTHHGFNPPCGCVAFSTVRLQALAPAMVGFNPPCGCVAFSTRSPRPTSPEPCRFQSALRMRGLFNAAELRDVCHEGEVSIRLADAWPFQQERSRQGDRARRVSIRLADAWPFQRG